MLLSKDDIRKSGALLLLLWASALTGCQKDVSTVLTSNINPAGWKNTEPVELEYYSNDTVRHFDISLFLVYNKDISTTGLSLEVTFTSPEDLQFRDIHRLDTGITAGNTNSLRETEIKLYTGAIFKEQGRYAIRISNNNNTPVKGIMAAGVKISPQNN